MIKTVHISVTRFVDFLPLWVIFEVYVAFGNTLNLIRPKILLLANFRC